MKKKEEMNRSEQIRNMSGLSRAAFAKNYNIPIRTLENWDWGTREAPSYILDLLERAVKEDFCKD